MKPERTSNELDVYFLLTLTFQLPVLTQGAYVERLTEAILACVEYLC